MSPRHHTVPRFYLRGFANAADQVTLVARDDPTQSFRRAVRMAASEVGFYRIETGDLAWEEDKLGYDPENVEAALSQLEGAIAPVVRTLTEGRSDDFDDEHWYRIVQFTALQTVRGHRWRNDLTALATLSVRTQILANLDDERAAQWLDDQGEPNGPEEVAAVRTMMAEEWFPRIVAPQAVMVQESLKMALGNPDTDDRGLAQYLIGKKPELILPRETAVLTSDEPICWWSPGDAPIGYATAQVVWVPLSPKLILQFREPAFDLSQHGLPDYRIRSNHDPLAVEVNRRVASQAERWIIHHPDQNPLAALELPPRQEWGEE